MTERLEHQDQLHRLFLPRKRFGLPVLALSIVVLLYLSQTNYLLFHAFVETFSIAVACGVFMIAWNSVKYHPNGFFFCLGVGSLIVAVMDLLHTMSYKGMGVFPEAGVNLPTQLWIVGRYFQAASFLAACFFLRRRAPQVTVFWSFFLAAVFFITLVFGGLFPDCFLPDSGLTLFKVGSEFLVCLLFSAALLMLYRMRQTFAPGVVRLLSAAIASFILGELSFTIYTDVFGFFNMAGHLFKIAGFYFVYRAVIETGLTRPYDLLFWELKISEENLRKRTAELEDANTEMEMTNEELVAVNDQLEATVTELEKANSDLEAFNYSVSHDLRSPLTVIQGHSDLILNIHSGKMDSEVEECLQTVLGQSKRMNQIISTLIDFSRISKSELRRQDVDLSAMAHQIALSLRQSDPLRSVTFQIDEGLSIEADPGLLAVLLDNLIGNAWKYTGKTRAAHIQIGATTTENGPAFFVRDNGAGFDLSEAGDLFAPFKRLHGREFEGTGIGLATVKRIVERHQGQVWAESASGKGSTFHFVL